MTVEGWVLRPPAHDDWAPDPAPAIVAYSPDGGEVYLCARSGNLTTFNISSVPIAVIRALLRAADR